jgi:hypothetical protein
MATDLLDKVEVEGNTFIILTKTRYLVLFSIPRTSIMPYNVTRFASTPGFQIRYNTSNPNVLEEWHKMITSLVGKGLFEAMSDGARVGFFPYPESKEYLQKYVKCLF